MYFLRCLPCPVPRTWSAWQWRTRFSPKPFARNLSRCWIKVLVWQWILSWNDSPKNGKQHALNVKETERGALEAPPPQRAGASRPAPHLQACSWHWCSHQLNGCGQKVWHERYHLWHEETKVLVRSERLRGVTYKTKKKRSPWWQHRGSVTLWGDTGWHCMCAAIFNPHRCPVSRGTEEVCDVSGRIKDGTQAAGHEPGNALSYGTFPSKPSYKRLSPFYR